MFPQCDRRFQALESSLIHSPMQLSPGTTPQKFGPDACKSLGQLRRQLLHLQRMGVDLWICRWKMVMVEAHWSPSTEWFANSLMMVFCESWSSGSLWSYWNWPVDAILGISRLGTKPDQPKSSCFSPRNRIQRSKESCRSLHPVHCPGRKLCGMKWENLTVIWETQNTKWWTQGSDELSWIL